LPTKGHVLQAVTQTVVKRYLSFSLHGLWTTKKIGANSYIIIS
jgi:hypothetical protein